MSGRRLNLNFSLDDRSMGLWKGEIVFTLTPLGRDHRNKQEVISWHVFNLTSSQTCSLQCSADLAFSRVTMDAKRIIQLWPSRVIPRGHYSELNTASEWSPAQRSDKDILGSIEVINGTTMEQKIALCTVDTEMPEHHEPTIFVPFTVFQLPGSSGRTTSCTVKTALCLRAYYLVGRSAEVGQMLWGFREEPEPIKDGSSHREWFVKLENLEINSSWTVSKTNAGTLVIQAIPSEQNKSGTEMGNMSGGAIIKNLENELRTAKREISTRRDEIQKLSNNLERANQSIDRLNNLVKELTSRLCLLERGPARGDDSGDETGTQYVDDQRKP